jgi:hypothetical protein
LERSNVKNEAENEEKLYLCVEREEYCNFTKKVGETHGEDGIQMKT